MPAQIVEIVSHMTDQGQDVLNRWHFLDTDGVADPAVLCADFTTQIINALLPALSNQCTFTELTYQQIYPVMKLQHGYATGYPILGGAGGPPAQSFVAASVRYNLADTVNLDGSPALKHIKRGGKRIGGTASGDGTDNSFSGAVARTAVDAAFNHLVAFPPDAWQAVVVRFPPSPAPVPPARTSPRLPPTAYALIVGHVLKATYGSQVSRKVGHGK